MKRLYHTFITRLGRTLGSPTPWLFLLGALAVGLLGEGASKGVDAWRTGEPVDTAVYTIALGAILLLVAVALFNVPAWLRSILASPHRTIIHVDEQVPYHRGLIALVSLGNYIAAENAMNHHGWVGMPGRQPVLTHCWLFAGPGEGENSSLHNAETLAETFRAKGVTVEIWALADADDVQEAYRAVKTIYEVAKNRYKLPQEAIIADYTGGTKSMTTGLTLAALERGGRLQYMKPNRYEADGRAERAAGSSPRLVRVDFVSVVEAAADTL